MNKKCPECGLLWNRKIVNNYKVILPKDCPGCRKLAPRASMRPMMPVRKQKRSR